MKINKKCLGLVAVIGLLGAGQAGAVTISLNGGSFLQAGGFTNDSGLVATSFVYDLGTAADGVATWDSAGTGTASNFLSNPGWFQTVTWSGLSIGIGQTFNFSGLDIDYIGTLAPLSIVESIIDNSGTTLRNASVRIGFADGSSCSAALNQTGWTVSQRLDCAATTSVPEPGTLALLGLGLAGFGVARRKRATT